MKRTTRLALPLLVIGSGIVYGTWDESDMRKWIPGAIGAFYLAAGLLLWMRPSRLSQNLAIAAWLPFVLVKPFVVKDVFEALGSDDPNYTPPRPTAPPPEANTREGRVNLLCRVLKEALGVDFRAHLPDSSFRDVHGIAPGNLLDVLDALHRDYSFAVSAADGDRVDSVKDLLVLLEQRHPYAAAS